MDVEKMRDLMVAAEVGSLNKAAEALNYTQAGLLHRMNSLEKEVGIPLLERTHSGVALTEPALHLAPAIRKLIEDYDLLQAEMERLRQKKTKTLHVAALASVAIHWLPGAAQRLIQKYPNVSVEFRMVDLSVSPEELLGRERMDVVFTSQVRPGNYDWIPLRKDPMLAVLPPEYDNGGAPDFPLERFDGMNVYVASQGHDVDLMHTMQNVAAKPNYLPTNIDDQALLSLVEHGMGATLMPALALQGRSYRATVLPVRPPSYRDLGLAVRSLEGAPPLIRDFIREAQRAAQAR